jgi:3-oxoacyl-[acyl-carrier-protein] synthase II
VILGTGIGGMETLSDQFRQLSERGPGRVSPFFIPMMIANMAAGQIAIHYGVTGPNSTVVTACAAGANAIGEAFRLIQRGEVDLMVTGGSEASLTPITVAGFCAMKALSTRNDEPSRASRPFDAARDGFVLGEGAGVVVLESYSHARARGARIHAELVGYGVAADAYHIAAPPPDGRGGAMSMRRALLDAGVEPAAVGYVNAHGTSTPSGDRGETLAIKAVFAEHTLQLPVSSNKSMLGHLLGAAGAVEFIATVLTLEHALLPPTVNYEQPDPECDLDYVPNQARPARVRVAISNSFGFGGQNATLVIRRWEE